MHKTTLFLSVVGLTFSPPALAEANDDVGGQDDIIVTALKRDQKLQDVPATVNVLTSEAIADRSVRWKIYSRKWPGLNSTRLLEIPTFLSAV